MVEDLMTGRPSVALLIVDMDNTLYDWVAFFVPAFYAMVDTAVDLLRVDREQLLDDLQAVHRTRGSPEHPFALLETAAVQMAMPELSKRERYQRLLPAFDAFDRVRVDTLCLYPGVRETLAAVRSAGAAIVAHTESTAVSIAGRIRMLDLEALLDAVFAPRFAGEPHPARDTRIDVESPLIRDLPDGARKPDPLVARSIASQWQVPTDAALYVGDSLPRDIAMARAAGMRTAWARYGTRHPDGYWNDLVRISNWTPASVRTHTTTDPDSIDARADVSLNSFDELLDHFTFSRGTNRLPRRGTSNRHAELRFGITDNIGEPR